MGYKVTRWIALFFYAALIIIPVTVVLFGSLKDMQQLFADPFGLPASWAPNNYVEVLGAQNLARSFRNSVIVTAASVALTLFIGSLAAYGTARLKGWLSWLIFAFLVAGMSVPAQANMIPQWVQFNRLGLLDNLLGLILINVVVGIPVSVFIMGGFMKTLPRELYEAAAVDGVGPWRTYTRIVLPLSMPSVAATAIFLFVIQWNELLYPLLFIRSPEKQTIPLTLLNFQGEFLTNYPLLFAGVAVASIPITIAYVFLQRYFVEGLTSGSIKG